MIYRFPIKIVRDMILNQINSNFFKSIEDESLISKHLPEALERFEKNIVHNSNSYYWKINDKGEREAYFNPLYTSQWLLFLYLLANTIYKCEEEKPEAARVLCDKIYGQSKSISGCDLYYEVEMPEVFSFDLPNGSYMGRAEYGDGFFFAQNCTVGHIDRIYPVIGKNVSMHTGSRILGNSHVGDNCIIGEGTIIKNQDVPANSIVHGISPDLDIKSR